MKPAIKFAAAILLLLCSSCIRKEPVSWKISDNPIVTEWSEDVDPAKPWLNYPRPGMVRTNWICLNGMWDYAVTPKDVKPEKWDGHILVPYPVESALSGVKKRVSENESLWYRCSFRIPNPWKSKHLLLNFEASDWETTVWIDGNEAGKHKGGYDPFTFDITPFLNKNKEHELVVCVWDPTDKGTQPRGKQVSSPQGIWYTPTTGIWQTVWIEPVNESYISSFRTVTNPDNGTISVTTSAQGSDQGEIKFVVKKDGKKIAQAEGKTGNSVTAVVMKPELWSPDSPALYDIEIELKTGNRTVDRVKTYTGFRKISVGKTGDGFTRMLLNNTFLWQNGPLDQGFWPDGIYTPPSLEAMVYDLKMTKKMGFNMLRKHVKVENRIFYYWCDKLGIMVWQDMPSGDKYIGGSDPDITKSKEATEQYEAELKRMIETKYNNPSIIMWVPFNEGWGQFETARITNLIGEYDTTRLVNSSSGWTDRGTGNVNDIHHYPDPATPPSEEKRAIALGEFGGLGLPVPGHTWEQNNWGYRNMEDSLQLLSKFEAYYEQVHTFVKEKGLSATIYTQTTDVETETNGLMTYDRKINKMGAENVFRAVNNIVPPRLVSGSRIFTDSFTAELENNRPGGKIYYTIDGSEPTIKSSLYNGPVTISETCSLKAFTKWDDAESRHVTFVLEKKVLMPALDLKNLKPGIKASIYEGKFTKMPEFSGLKPVRTRTTQVISQSIAEKDSFFALVFEGYLLIPTDGVYGLFVNSDDGSRFVIDNNESVVNDGIHGMKEEGKYFPLAAGYHKIRVEYFQGEGGLGLEFHIAASSNKKNIAPSSMFFN